MLDGNWLAEQNKSGVRRLSLTGTAFLQALHEAARPPALHTITALAGRLAWTSGDIALGPTARLRLCQLDVKGRLRPNRRDRRAETRAWPQWLAVARGGRAQF